MKTSFKFGIFAEDDAHKNFLRKYLEYVSPGKFEENFQYGYRFKAVQPKHILTQLPNVLRATRIEFNLDVVFIGKDSETPRKEDINQRKQLFINAKNIYTNSILLLPVQCIEHWLWYLKWKIENPDSSKNIELENQPNKEAKTAVYGGRKSVENQLPEANKILKHLDIAYLESRSASFRHFHHQVLKFLRENETSQ